MATQTNMEAETFRHTNSGMLFVASSYVELRGKGENCLRVKKGTLTPLLEARKNRRSREVFNCYG